MRRSIVTASLVVVTLAITLAAEARDHRYRGGAQNYAVAESRFGHGRVSGPVRMTELGPQVRLPGGSWIHCRKSCSETLRVESVDFWENQNERNRTDNECGLFGCLTRGFAF